jgi:hypothetical protein
MQTTRILLPLLLSAVLPLLGQNPQRILGAPNPDAALHEYHFPGGGDDIVRVFYLNHANTPQQLQEVVTLVRSIADVRRLFTYNELRAFAARGTADQIALVSWLVEQLDQPVKSDSRAKPSHAPPAR